MVANKVDSERREAEAWELSSLGLGTPHLISALHGRGVGDLLDAVVARLPELSGGGRPDPGATATAPARTPSKSTERPRGCRDHADGAEASPAISSVAIIGRPNVGKSTLFNRLVGEDRSVVHDLPGTTRDAIDTVIETDMGSLRLVDTAGMRRRAREGDPQEYFSLVRSLRALDRSDVALLVLDATEGVTHQDQRLAERIDASGQPAVLLLNKWDLLDTDERLDVGEEIGEKLAFLGYAPVLRISAKSGLGVHRLLPVIDEAITAYHRRIPTVAPQRGPESRPELLTPLRVLVSSTPCRALSTRPRSRCSPRGGYHRRTCGTSSDRCASGSSSGRRRSRCACG